MRRNEAVMKDLKREITLMAGIIVLSVIAVTTLGISKISNSLNVSSAAETGEKTGKLAFSQIVSSLKAGSKSKFGITGGKGEDITWSVSDKKYAVINQKGVLQGKRAGKVTVYAKSASDIISYTVNVEGKKKIAIDAGHQKQGDSSTEPAGPGSSVKKAKVAGGATGVATGVPEYQLTLDVAKKLQKELLDRGYEVYMVRTKNNVNISNKKRAVKVNKSGSDIYIRIHGDSASSSSARGASALYPSKSNPYVGKLSKKSLKLSKAVLNSYCDVTGIKNRGCIIRDDLTGTNWSEIPVTLIEMGFMSNSAEDKKMQKKAFQNKMAKGMADGIDSYFGY